MTVALEQHTVLPSESSRPALLAMSELLEPGHERAKLVGPDGTTVELPDQVYQVLRDVAAAMSRGLAITVAPHNTLLTTQEAADLLSISRPTLVRLLTDGLIAFELRGRHRRIRLADLLEYQRTVRTERRKILDQMTRDAEDDGLYDTDESFVHTR